MPKEARLSHLDAVYRYIIFRDILAEKLILYCNNVRTFSFSKDAFCSRCGLVGMKQYSTDEQFIQFFYHIDSRQ